MADGEEVKNKSLKGTGEEGSVKGLGCCTTRVDGARNTHSRVGI